MKLTTLKSTSVLGVSAVAVALGVVIAASAVASQSPERPENAPDANAALAAVKAGKARKIPGPDVSFSAFWQGCRFVIHASKVSHYDTHAEPITVEEKPEPLASTPPAGQCAERAPTQEEIDAMKADVNARNARNRPAGAPPLPAYTPDDPRTGEAITTPPIPPAPGGPRG
ncbi:MAG: hypothetical protein M3203_15210 [Actinomycetota bacterium]|nr:hypothetical protein [Actinomycetota bacterium]